ncbi:unnamed protein product [Zymoseptoria tritici ST99CH_3D7]|uniref:Aminoglycoside phosphotransferase domain-containing protein n=1 Tax=Zymoseptoria tritici (strain ST99CH_3D7) TaxID=1276538 RepID=A0A1X7RM20_ZYMT9|nr:unnamed protein product [Zymoseptoria tritici ST99CH_3D7]
MAIPPDHQQDDSLGTSVDTKPSADESTAETKDSPGAEGQGDAASATSGDSWEDEQPPLQLNYDALKHIATYFIPGTRGKCIDITNLQRGTFHEIRELHFADGSTCIGRFTRDKKEHVSVLESETATVDYVRQHTSIRVPDIYFINCNPQHVVGAAFVLMEKLPGRHLYCFWEKLGLKHKLAVVEAIAGVLAQLMKLEFDTIGSMTAGGEIGPLCDMAYPDEQIGYGPFDNTLDYFLSFLKPGVPMDAALAKQYDAVGTVLRSFFEKQRSNPIYHAPYRMIHGDFDAQNMLFEFDDGEEPPRLVGIIDWDYSHSGPIYSLCEYPIFIQDVDWQASRPFYRQNRVLRKFFVQKLANHYPKGSNERRNVKECFRQKNYTVNWFDNSFMGRHWPTDEDEAYSVRQYLYGHGPADPGDDMQFKAPYGGRWGWEADSEMGSEDEVGEVEGDGIDEKGDFYDVGPYSIWRDDESDGEESDDGKSEDEESSDGRATMMAPDA